MVLGLDDAIRQAAFAYVQALLAESGGFVRRAELLAFEFQGVRIPLVSHQQGIWKPRQMEAALSILTTYAATPEQRPYEDAIGPDGYPRYKWRGSNPDFWDNVALRKAMELRRPLLWFIGVAPGVYNATFPVWLAAEEPGLQQFVVALDDLALDQWAPTLAGASLYEPVRRYAEVLVKERLHQKVFRNQVLLAYRSQCALCRLRHTRLLDAAHIREDSQGGLPIVPNGLAMCAIHHRAFDADVLGIRPDYRVEIRPDVLAEHDGPTLQHALQAMHGGQILVPRRANQRPSPDLLEERYERFRASA